jgi:hypothetical protein
MKLPAVLLCTILAPAATQAQQVIDVSAQT